MDIKNQIIILQNPNGTIQVGTQPWLKNKKAIRCYNCKINIIFEGYQKIIQCTKCKVNNQVPVEFL